MLTTIRSKPDHIKKSIALVLTFVVFSGIVFMWWSSRDARSQELVVQSKIVSPLEGVTSLFSGFVSGVKERMAEKPVTKNASVAVATTTEDALDLSRVVIIDPSVSTSTIVATSTTAGL